jgi:hypothetical protein
MAASFPNFWPQQRLECNLASNNKSVLKVIWNIKIEISLKSKNPILFVLNFHYSFLVLFFTLFFHPTPSPLLSFLECSTKQQPHATCH